MITCVALEFILACNLASLHANAVASLHINVNRKLQARLPTYLPTCAFNSMLPSNRYPSSTFQKVIVLLQLQEKRAAPIVVVVPGGMWAITLRMWVPVFAKLLVEAGAMVVVLDYRAFPEGRSLGVPSIDRQPGCLIKLSYRAVGRKS